MKQLTFFNWCFNSAVVLFLAVCVTVFGHVVFGWSFVYTKYFVVAMACTWFIAIVSGCCVRAAPEYQAYKRSTL